MFDCTLQTIVAVVVLPIPGGPDNKAALNPAPVSSLPKNLPEINNNTIGGLTDFFTHFSPNF